MCADNIKNLRSRIRSIRNAQKIARAMFISASVKYRRAAELAEGGRYSFNMARTALALLTPYMETQKRRGRKCIIVIGGDRGMSGGYNGAVLKEAMRHAGENSVFLPVGRRIAAKMSAAGLEMIEGERLLSEKPDAGRLKCCMQQLAEGLFTGEISRIDIIYTDFEGRMRSRERCECLYPPEVDMKEAGRMIFEPEPAEFARSVFVDLLCSAVSGAVTAANACEQLARRMAMDSAQKNAQQMMDEMRNRLNRTRQAGITQELVEAVSGETAEGG